VSRGALCPKGSATFHLVVNPNRVTKVWYRAPGATEWGKTKTVEWAMPPYGLDQLNPGILEPVGL
jgi:formate dehydrogenase major subunit